MMNIRRNTFAVLAAAALLASCSQDELMTASPDGLVPVTLSAAVGDGVQTRAATDGVAERCVIQILEKNGDGWSNAIGLGIEKNPIDVEQDVDNPTQFTLTGVLLNPDKEYTFLFWADEDKGFYDASDLENVKIVNGNATNIAIAWQGKATWDKTKGSTITAELTHAVAKVTLQSTTTVESGRKFVLSNLTEYNGFDVMNGTANGDIVTPGHEGTGTGALGDLLSFYALVTDENQELKLTSGEGGGVVSIPNVPLAPNTHVILNGDVQDAGWTTVNFTASVETTWGSTPIIGEGYEIDSEGNYTVTTAEGLKAWAAAVQSNSSLNCTLADDIILPEATDGRSNWTTVGNFAGTFDGAGHTITGLTGTGGLIGEIGSGGKVQNLTLEEVDIKEGGMVGAIVGQNSGEITDCSVQGSVAGTKAGVGGIAGINNGAVTGCSMEGIVTNTSSNTGTGGIVGLNENGSVIDCHSSATVTGYSGVGGIVGKMYQDNPVVIACYSTGNVTGTGRYYSDTGGVVGNGSVGAIICCYATGDISGELPNIGGVVGYNRCNVVACYYAGSNISGVSVIGGVAGVNDTNGTITACYWSNYTGSGIGNDKTNAGETTKVDGVWTDAVSKMNNALTDYDWEWSLDTTNPYALPTPVKRVTN